MTGVSPNVAVSKKRMARTYEEDGVISVQLSTNRLSRRSSADDSALESTTSKDSSISRASGTPTQMRDQDKDRDAPAHRLEEVDIEGFRGEVAIRSRSSSILSGMSPSSTVPTTKEPLNFGFVIPGVYRCSQPTMNDHGFVKNLGLKSVLSLISGDDLDADFTKFMGTNQIRHYIIGMRGTKKQAIPLATVKSIVSVLLDPQNHPIMLHCSHGKHRTGCVVGIVRKVSGWTMQNILDEYRSYAAPKIRECDLDYLSAFQTSDLDGALTMVRPKRRPYSFYRTLVVTAVVMLIWIFSSVRMANGPIEFGHC